MQAELMERVNVFLASRPRYKLVICRDNPFVDVPICNLGYSLSKYIGEVSDKSTLVYSIPDVIDNEFGSKTIRIADIADDLLVVENIGILFERELGISPIDVIMKHSKGKTLLLNWDGDYKERMLYYRNNPGYKIDLSNINHIIL